MGLKIYNDVSPDTVFSTEGSFDNPLTHSFNGTTGEVIERRYYIRNDDASRWYSNISVQPVVSSGDDIVDGVGSTEGYSWKVLAGDSQPLEEQWELKDAGEAVSLGSDIGSGSVGDTTTYLPFWLRIQIPPNAPIASYQGIVLKIETTEGLVTP